MKRIGPEGARRPKNEIRSQPWTFGWLNVGPEPQARHAKRAERAAVLMPVDGSMVAIAELHAAVLTIEKRGILLDGVEESFGRKERFVREETWWCKPITEEDFQRATSPDLIDAAERLEQVADATGLASSYSLGQQLFIERVSSAIGRELDSAEEAYLATACDQGAKPETVAQCFRTQDAVRRDLQRTAELQRDHAAPSGVVD